MIILALPSFLMLFIHYVASTQSDSEDEARTHSIREMDWDKFDHMYDIGHDRPKIRSTPPPEPSREAKLALNLFSYSHDRLGKTSTPIKKALPSPEIPGALTPGQRKYKYYKQREQQKLASMSKEERDAHYEKKRQTHRRISQNILEKAGYRTYRSKLYNELKEAINEKTAKPEQIELFEQMKHRNRVTSNRWRKQQSVKVKQKSQPQDENIQLSPQQSKLKEKREKGKIISQRYRDRKKHGVQSETIQKSPRNAKRSS